MLKRGVFIALFVILLTGFISAIPFISFVNPTPDDSTQTTGSSLIINSTITGVSKLLQFVFNWQGTNYTLYDEDLILHLNLNNNSLLGENDTHVYDSSRAGHNGSVLGGAEFISSGKYSGGYSFNSSSGYIEIPDSELFNSSGNLSFSMWIKLNQDKKFTQISGGYRHICGLLVDGTAYCWGGNTDGELGDGSFDAKSIPTLVKGGHNFSKIYSGWYTTCGLLHNGSALCWGENKYGGLGIGNGNKTFMNTPQFVSGGYTFKMLSEPGENHNCGLLENGSAMCWGWGGNANLGLGGTNSTSMSAPTYVYGNYSFSKIFSAEDSNFGIFPNGSVFYWGQGKNGQLGSGSTSHVYTPTYMKDHNFTIIQGAEDSNCGLHSDGKALCWGEAGFKLGIGNITDIYYPTPVLGEYTFKDIDTRSGHSCGLLHNGSIMCWGQNIYGQLGNRNTTNMHYPQLVQGNYNFSKISLIGSATCGLTQENDLYCWGGNTYGELGRGEPSINTPRKLIKENFVNIQAGRAFSCGLLSNGSALCLGRNDYGQLGIGNLSDMKILIPVSGGYNFSKLFIGSFHSCGLLHNGSALCWGYNNLGQLGTGNTINMNTPTYVLGGNSFKDIFSDGYNSCGLLHNGSALCWGSNGYGGLGIGNTTQMNTPTYVLGGYNFSLIDIGIYTICGLLHNGSALCWGYNPQGQLGIGNTTNMDTPQYVKGDYNFLSISFSDLTACGLLHNGSALCWGQNTYGQLGIGNTTNMKTPQWVLGGYNFSSVSGGYVSCGLLHNGSALCWGWNTNGALGIGNTTNMDTPQYVKGDYNFSYFDVDYTHSLAIDQNRNYFSWGINSYGELGLPFSDNKIPIPILKNSILFGRTDDLYSLKIGYSDNLVVSLGGFPIENNNAGYDWTQILFTYENISGELKLYSDGELKSSRITYKDFLNPSSNIFIGKNVSGQIDEIMMWNRTLSESEIKMFYNSSLKQINSTSWEFYSNQSLSTDKKYNYGIFAWDTLGLGILIQSINKYTEFPEEEQENSPPGGGPGNAGIEDNTPEINKEKLQEGQSRQLREGYKVTLEFARQGSKTLEVVKIDKDNNLVRVSVGVVTEIEIVNGSTEKIDVNNDGFYDLEVSVEDISETGSSRLKFKEIYEEIVKDVQAEVEEEQKEEIANGEDDGVVVDEKSKWWKYVAGAGIVILIVVLVWFGGRRENNSK